jgi:hypothetical protein
MKPLEKIVCLNQITEHKIDLSNKYHGDCRICKPDYKNKLCSGYYPIKIYTIEVQEK